MKNLKKTEREKKNDYYITKYGLTIDEVEERKKNGCEGCGIKEGVLCIDHIHVLGFKTLSPEAKRKYVRGVACFLCNTGFRVFERTKDGKRNRQMLEGTIKYFSKYPLKGEL